MRAAERLLGRNSVLLMTSSPAFVREYFEPFRQFSAPVALLQNKVLEIAGRPAEGLQLAAPPADGEAWKIGWFGALRCRKSLALLAAFTRRMDGRFEVVLRGRPAYSEFGDFDGLWRPSRISVLPAPTATPRISPRSTAKCISAGRSISSRKGLNSNWLLPNRLYEGCRFGAVPIAMKQTETGRFLADRHLGLLLDDPSPDALAALLGGLDRRRNMPRSGGRSWRRIAEPGSATSATAARWSTGCKAWPAPLRQAALLEAAA